MAPERGRFRSRFRSCRSANEGSPRAASRALASGVPGALMMPSSRLLAVCWSLLALAAASRAQPFNGRTAAEWVKDLAAAEADTRDYAIWALGAMGERAVRATRRALDDPRPHVRQAAAVALGRLGAVAAEARDRLVALCADPDAAVAKAAKVAALRVQVDAEQMPQLR